MGGIGLGLGYVTPVATIARWFPDRKGLATGMVVMGFGLGALFMSKVLAPLLLDLTGRNLVSVFLLLGGVFLVLGVGSAGFMKNPPAGWLPKGCAEPGLKAACAEGEEIPLRNAILSGRFLSLWIVFFCNITAGISIISFQSPLFQDLWKRFNPGLAAAALAGFGATLVAVSSLFNGAGRFLWGAASDRIGRARTFRVMLASEVLVFALLVITKNPWVFAVLVCWVLLCYGGGFGAMPSFIGDVFGSRLDARCLRRRSHRLGRGGGRGSADLRRAPGSLERGRRLHLVVHHRRRVRDSRAGAFAPPVRCKKNRIKKPRAEGPGLLSPKGRISEARASSS